MKTPYNSLHLLRPLKAICPALALMAASAWVLISCWPAHSTVSAQTKCGPMDVAFVVDDTGSMGGAINNVKSELASILNSIETASGNDYQLALVTFKDNITVRANFAPNNRAAVEPLILGLTASSGGGGPEASDEAVNTVVNALPAAGRPQNIDFTPAFRDGALKILILVTDAPPGGFDDAFTPADQANADARATEAASKGIKISAIYVPTSFNATTRAIMENYATRTGGVFIQTAANGTGTAGAIMDIIDACGGAPPVCGLQAPQIVKARPGSVISFIVSNQGPLATTVTVRPFFNSACFFIFPSYPQQIALAPGGSAFFDLNARNCPPNAGRLPPNSILVIEATGCETRYVQIEWIR